MGWTIRDGVCVEYDGREPTEAEAAQALAELAASEQQAGALATIYAPVTYNGKQYPVDPGSMAKYEIAKQSRGRGKLSRGVAIATDGSVLKLSSTAEIDAFHAAMEDALTARVQAVHDAL